MTEQLLSKLKEMAARHPFMFAASASNKQIEQSEGALNFTFPKEYKEFLKIYGGAMIGPYPVYGTDPVDLMDSRSNTVELATKRFIDDGWSNVNNGIVISENHAGDPVILMTDGTVAMASHNGIGELAWSSFGEFLNWCANR